MAIQFNTCAKEIVWNSAAGYAAAWMLGDENPLSIAGYMAIAGLIAEVTLPYFNKINADGMEKTWMHYTTFSIASASIANCLKLADLTLSRAIAYTFSLRRFHF